MASMLASSSSSSTSCIALHGDMTYILYSSSSSRTSYWASVSLVSQLLLAAPLLYINLHTGQPLQDVHPICWLLATGLRYSLFYGTFQQHSKHIQIALYSLQPVSSLAASALIPAIFVIIRRLFAHFTASASCAIMKVSCSPCRK